MNINSAILISKDELSWCVWRFRFKAKSPLINFIPGQYISIIIDPSTRRQYSISNYSSASFDEFEIIVDIKPNGVGTTYLKNLNVGDEISFIGPIGRFVLAENLSKDLYFIATGTGIAPFKSMIEFLIHKNLHLSHNIHVHFGTRFSKDLFCEPKNSNNRIASKRIDNEAKLRGDSFCVDLFEEYLQKGYIKEYKKYLSQEDFPNTTKGYVTEFIKTYNFSTPGVKGLSDIPQFFICGSGEMIKSAEQMLLEKNIPEENIHFEKFY